MRSPEKWTGTRHCPGMWMPHSQRCCPTRLDSNTIWERNIELARTWLSRELIIRFELTILDLYKFSFQFSHLTTNTRRFRFRVLNKYLEDIYLYLFVHNLY